MGVQVSDPGPPPLSRSGAMDTLAGQRRQRDQDPCSGRSPCCFARTGSGRAGNGTSFTAMASGWIIIPHSPFERLIFVSCGRIRVRRELMIFRYEWEKLPPGSIHCLYL